MYNSRSTTTLNKNNVEGVIVSSPFTHSKFEERKDIDGNGNSINSGNWNSETGKLTLGGKLTQPGIYTGEVEVTFKGGTKEKYAITLRKLPNDMLSFTTEVEVGRISVKGLMLDNGSGSSTYDFNGKGSDITLTNKSTGKIAKVKSSSGNNFTFDVLDLSSNGDLNPGDVLELKATYGNSKQTITSEIVLVKQSTPKIQEVILTNDKTNGGVKTQLESSIKSNFTTSHTTSVPNLENDKTDYSVKVGANSSVLVSYSQTQNNQGKVGGGQITTRINGTNIDFSIGNKFTVDPNQDNYLPNVNVRYGRQNNNGGQQTNTGFIGDYKFNIGDQSVVHFDALKGFTPSVLGSGEANNVHYLQFINDATGNTGLIRELDHNNEITGAEVKTVTLNLDSKLEHGYSSIAGSFEVDYHEDQQKINSVNAQMTQGAHKLSGIISTVSAAPVKFSAIIVADVLDGSHAQTKFQKTGQTEGILTLVGGKSAIGNTDLSNVTLTLDNGTAAIIAGQSSGNDLVFQVGFSGGIPQNINWTLGANGVSTKLKGMVSTNSVEAVNITKLSATNNGTQGLNDQFAVEAGFGIQENGTVTVDGLSSNRVTLTQFSTGAHKVNLKVASGKYQGKYTNGIMVSRGSFTL